MGRYHILAAENEQLKTENRELQARIERLEKAVEAAIKYRRATIKCDLLEYLDLRKKLDEALANLKGGGE